MLPISRHIWGRKSAAAAIVVSCVVAGCTSDGDDASSSGAGAGGATTGQGGAAGGSASATAFCSVVDPYCEALFACCPNATPTPVGYASVDDCKTKFAMDCATRFTPLVDAQINAGNTLLDPMALDACTTRLTAMKPGGSACSAPPDLVFWYDCFGAFQGQIPPGGSCLAQGEVPSFIYCKDGLCPAGQCVAFLATGNSCQPTDTCNLIAGDGCIHGTCAKRGDLGAPCSPASSDNNLQCKSMSCGPAGTCILPTLGALCSED